jgi:hypothetical protein
LSGRGDTGDPSRIVERDETGTVNLLIHEVMIFLPQSIFYISTGVKTVSVNCEWHLIYILNWCRHYAAVQVPANGSCTLAKLVKSHTSPGAQHISIFRLEPSVIVPAKTLLGVSIVFNNKLDS